MARPVVTLPLAKASGERNTKYIFHDEGYCKNRCYSLDMGRFVSRDPAKKGLDSYEYVLGKPTFATDKLGLFDCACEYNVRRTIGGIIIRAVLECPKYRHWGGCGWSWYEWLCDFGLKCQSFHIRINFPTYTETATGITRPVHWISANAINRNTCGPVTATGYTLTAP